MSVASNLRVGIDVTYAHDVRQSIEEFGDRYLERIYTPEELVTCAGPLPQMAARLAARFAAKEATVKVLRPSEQAPDWRSIEVRTHPSGWTELHLTGAARKLADASQLSSFAVSVSHEHDVATAVVIAT
ncbi:MAG: holo-ACP synthase [Candidatus Nanopelagicales bacterium]